MSVKNLFVAFSAAIIAVGCATTSKPASETISVKHIESAVSNQKGFSLEFSDKEAWTVAEETPYKIVYSKQETDSNNQHLIQALVVKLPNFDSDQEFLKYVEKSIDKNRQEKNGKVVEQQVGFASNQGEKCVRYNSKEKPAIKSKKNKPVVLEVVNYTCRHPDKAYTGVYMAYSKIL